MLNENHICTSQAAASAATYSASWWLACFQAAQRTGIFAIVRCQHAGIRAQKVFAFICVICCLCSGNWQIALLVVALARPQSSSSSDAHRRHRHRHSP